MAVASGDGDVLNVMSWITASKGKFDMVQQNAAVPSVVAPTRDRLGESVLWHPEEQTLYWIDLLDPTIHRMRGGRGEPESWRIPGTRTLGSLTFAAGGRLMLAVDQGLVLFDPKTARMTPFADPNDQREEVVYNDSKIDRDGRLWIGTYEKDENEPKGVLYSVERDGRYRLADSGFPCANGPAISPDGNTLYFSDTVGKRVLAYSIERDTGRLRSCRRFASIDPGQPDGLATDAAGRLWVAHYRGSRVTRFLPDGTVDLVIPLPTANVTSCCLGGRDMTTLFITTAEAPATPTPLDGALFAVEVDGPGLPEPIFDPIFSKC
ncbi:MAG: SMP-30/gluconolactonase/LRE family protein [Hyphomicrobiaceae bacterium]